VFGRGHNRAAQHGLAAEDCFRSDEKGSQLSKEDFIEVTGKVVEKFKAGMFSIETKQAAQCWRRWPEGSDVIGSRL
jgi:hypothetical protein